jgi:hypothetical protein
MASTILTRAQEFRSWAAARLVYKPDLAAAPGALDKMIVWKLREPKPSNSGAYANMAQRQWTIEVRADFSDPAKNAEIKQLVQQHAVSLHAFTALLSDVQPPQVVCFSEDFFEGHQEIALHENTLGAAIKEHMPAMGAPEEVSDEMRALAIEMAAEKNAAK